MSPRTKNWIYIGVILLLLIIIGVLAWFLATWHRPPLPTSTPTATSTASNTVPATNIADTSGPATHITQNSQYYNIDLQYPSSTPLAKTAGATADTGAVQTLQQFSQSTANNFVEQNSLSNPSAQEIQAITDEGLDFSLTDSYQFFSSPTTISYLFALNEDTGGAHPNTSFYAVTFDAQSGQSLTLSDLFRPGADYLDTLSSISQQMLTQQLGQNADQSTISSGTAPQDSNFENFALDGSNLDIFFAPYQVADFASGPQTVKIPLTELSSILNSKYQ